MWDEKEKISTGRHLHSEFPEMVSSPLDVDHTVASIIHGSLNDVRQPALLLAFLSNVISS